MFQQKKFLGAMAILGAMATADVVAAADLDASKSDPKQKDQVVSKSFDSLVVDGGKAKDLLIFRLAESITTILIEEKVKKAIEEADFKLIRIYDTKNIAIL